MNIIGGIILAALAVDFILHMLADILNLGMLKEELPRAFSDVYDADSYRRSQEYLRATTQFEWVVSTVDLFVVLVFWFGKCFPLLDGWVRSAGQGPVVTGLMYMAALILLKAALALPFRIYSIFVIEERFGFNKTTWKTFLADIIKGTLLGILLGAPLLAGILAFFEYAGANAWWYCWIAVTLFMLTVQFIAPTWIFPLFNKFKPIDNEGLKDAVLSYARSIQFPLENVFVMDGSKRSTRSNAFFTGFGRHKRIVLFDTLLEKHTIEELVAILAHEMGHYKKRHIQKMLLMGIVQTGIMFFLLSLFISWQPLFEAFYMTETSVYAGLIFFGMLYAPIDFFAGMVMQMLSRKNEYQADRFAAQTTGNQQPLIDALKKLSVSNLANLVPHPFYVFLNYSHPPLLQRINALEGVAPVATHETH